jgi:hypothetical protein
MNFDGAYWVFWNRIVPIPIDLRFRVLQLLPDLANPHGLFWNSFLK